LGDTAVKGYSELGIRRIINANATLTRLGGSIMPPEVIQAMHDASRCFIDLDELQRRVGERLATLTQNEAAYVSSGAAAGLTLATAACVVGSDVYKRNIFPDLREYKNEVIVQRLHRNGYDYAVCQVGVTIMEIGDERGTSSDDLLNAINEKTAAIFWFQGAMNKPSELPLQEVIAIAKTKNIPVIVDAAAQLPPVSNLWNFTKMGAALAIFSGGKDLCGPQSSGLVLGRADLVEAIRIHGSPNQGVGRPMKVGKEEMMGLLAAVERYLNLDHEARAQKFEDIVSFWNKGLSGISGVVACRDFPNEAGQPVPRTYLEFSEKFSRDVVIKQLLEGEPAISVAPADDNGIYLNPMTLGSGEEMVVLERLLELLA
jgi:D-glucosaminate-6-phosphate ammonia-lyase